MLPRIILTHAFSSIICAFAMSGDHTRRESEEGKRVRYNIQIARGTARYRAQSECYLRQKIKVKSILVTCAWGAIIHLVSIYVACLVESSTR